MESVAIISYCELVVNYNPLLNKQQWKLVKEKNVNNLYHILHRPLLLKYKQTAFFFIHIFDNKRKKNQPT